MKTRTLTQDQLDSLVNARLDKLRRHHAREIAALRQEIEALRRSPSFFGRLRDRFRPRPTEQTLQTDSDTRSR
jgi:hypothetical protein